MSRSIIFLRVYCLNAFNLPKAPAKLPPNIGNAEFRSIYTPGYSFADGNFLTQSYIAYYSHQYIPPNKKKLTKRSCQFRISTYYYNFDGKQVAGFYWFQLEFQYNGNDLFAVRIMPLPNQYIYNEILGDKFTITFTPKPKSTLANPVAEIIYYIEGTWFRQGTIFKFDGTITVSADGNVKFPTFKSSSDRVALEKRMC